MSACLTANGLEVLTKRYLLKDAEGRPAETVPEMFHRVASHVAVPEGKDKMGFWTEIFEGTMRRLEFLPNTPTFTGAGTRLGQLAACFVLPIDDDLGRDSQDGIFSTLQTAAMIQQGGGGVGCSWSRLRERNSVVKSCNGRSSGPIPFLRAYSTCFDAIQQGFVSFSPKPNGQRSNLRGTRRGANMAVLDASHPDIFEFIECKDKEGELANFNLSVGVTDALMEAARVGGGAFPLVSPNTHQIVKLVDASTLLDTIVDHALFNGEPGLLFLDEINRKNPCPHLYRIESTNPCGEQALGPHESCNLGSINLARHVRLPEDMLFGSIDWEKLAGTVRVAVRFLDDVVSANNLPTAKLREASTATRRIGLGFMGLADLLFVLGVRYGSALGIDVAMQVAEFIQYHAMLTSVKLAKERGPFPALRGSCFDPANFTWAVPAEAPLIYLARAGRPPLDWPWLIAEIKGHGIRNAAVTTVAPTGTIATVAGCEGYGIEPAFSLFHRRFVLDQQTGERKPMDCASALFARALNYLGVSPEAVDTVRQTGSCADLSRGTLPPGLAEVFITAREVTAEEHVKMQAAVQRFFCNSISKTINLPPTATLVEAREAIFLAWKLKCRGITVYRSGSRQTEVLVSGGDKKL